MFKPPKKVKPPAGIYTKFTVISLAALIVLTFIGNQNDESGSLSTEKNYANEIEKTLNELNEQSQANISPNQVPNIRGNRESSGNEIASPKIGVSDIWQKISIPVGWTYSDLNHRTRIYKSRSGLDVCQIVVDNIAGRDVTKEVLFDNFENDVKVLAQMGIEQALQISGMGNVTSNSVAINASTILSEKPVNGEWRTIVVVQVALEGSMLQSIIHGMLILDDQRMNIQCGGSNGQIRSPSKRFLSSVSWK